MVTGAEIDDNSIRCPQQANDFPCIIPSEGKMRNCHLAAGRTTLPTITCYVLGVPVTLGMQPSISIPQGSTIKIRRCLEESSKQKTRFGLDVQRRTGPPLCSSLADTPVTTDVSTSLPTLVGQARLGPHATSSTYSLGDCKTVRRTCTLISSAPVQSDN